jgi:hypothetical protein
MELCQILMVNFGALKGVKRKLNVLKLAGSDPFQNSHCLTHAEQLGTVWMRVRS